MNGLKYKDRTDTRLVILHDSHSLPDNYNPWTPDAHTEGLKMGLLSIGYNYIIERDGSVVECRGRYKVGSHTPGLNMDSIGVCLVGGREEEGGPGVDNFTRGQRGALLVLLHEIKAEWPGLKVKSHSEVQRFRDKGHPKCPPIDMDILRDDLKLFAQGIVL